MEFTITFSLTYRSASGAQLSRSVLSGKEKSSEKVKLVHEDKIITNDNENAKILNSFFSNVVKHFKIPEVKSTDFSTECISHPALKAIMKFRNHRSVSAIRIAFNPRSFSFSKVSVDDVLKEIKNLVMERQCRALTFL